MQAMFLDSQEIMQAIGAGELGLLLACSVQPVRQQIPGSTPSAPTFEPGGVQEPSGDKFENIPTGLCKLLYWRALTILGRMGQFRS
jgi:hypothetical protein